MHLISKREQDVHVGDETVHIEKGEHLTTEFCHKYTLESVRGSRCNGGLVRQPVWMDAGEEVQRAAAGAEVAVG
jgi:uncharacterized SAM-dependent methyltransferase